MILWGAALAINNQEVKDQVRELWAIPLLVNLISDVRGLSHIKAAIMLQICGIGEHAASLYAPSLLLYVCVPA